MTLYPFREWFEAREEGTKSKIFVDEFLDLEIKQIIKGYYKKYSKLYDDVKSYDKSDISDFWDNLENLKITENKPI